PMTRSSPSSSAPWPRSRRAGRRLRPDAGGAVRPARRRAADGRLPRGPEEPMAKGTKELKQRITGVKNIQQITRAMEMVATQKLKRLQGRADAVRPFSAKLQEMVARLAGSVTPGLSPLL